MDLTKPCCAMQAGFFGYPGFWILSLNGDGEPTVWTSGFGLKRRIWTEEDFLFLHSSSCRSGRTKKKNSEIKRENLFLFPLGNKTFYFILFFLKGCTQFKETTIEKNKLKAVQICKTVIFSYMLIHLLHKKLPVCFPLTKMVSYCFFPHHHSYESRTFWSSVRLLWSVQLRLCCWTWFYTVSIDAMFGLKQ